MEREARDQRLGLVATSEANALRDPNPPRRPGVGGFGSFGLLLLRLVVAGMLGVASMQILTSINATADYLGQTLIPYPREVAWGLGFGLAVMAVMLVLGLGVRAVGLLLALLAIGSLIFVRWGPFPSSPRVWRVPR
nr:DoxX family protein [Tessaracoccus coleopterorum]